MPREEPEQTAHVRCADCGTPGVVTFKGDLIIKAFFVCKCPRPTIEKANAEAKKRSEREA